MADAGRRAIRAIVRGRVQGVGFRWATRREARKLGLAGWVRNTADGAVEVMAQGTPNAVDNLVEFLRKGPPGSRVASLVTEEAAMNDGIGAFDITF